MKELDFIDHFRIIMSPRKRFLDQIVKALEPMNDIVGKEEEIEAILQSAENILEEIHDKYTQDQHIAIAKFYSEAKQTVGRGILSGLIKE
jgi:ABC-type Fe3+-citrate transport system substrate-binding protein